LYNYDGILSYVKREWS